MCDGLALARNQVPTEAIARFGLRRRTHLRGRSREFRFFLRDKRPRIPIIRDGEFLVVRWGNSRGQSRVLPRTGTTWLSTLESGGWQGIDAVSVVIPATFVLERGVWYPVTEGVRGLLVPDEQGVAVAYVVCEPASHYFRIMTRSDRMPLLIRDPI